MRNINRDWPQFVQKSHLRIQEEFPYLHCKPGGDVLFCVELYYMSLTNYMSDPSIAQTRLSEVNMPFNQTCQPLTLIDQTSLRQSPYQCSYGQILPRFTLRTCSWMVQEGMGQRLPVSRGQPIIVVARRLSVTPSVCTKYR